jgi:GntR family transcriptional regulator
VTIFLIDPRSGVPIYIQLVDQVKRAVSLGTLSPGEQLPTVKALALDLTVNANTVARAYRELERDRVIETSPGRGSFVRSESGAAEVRRAIHDVGASVLADAVRETRSLGLERAMVRSLFEHALDRWFPGTAPATTLDIPLEDK